MAKVKVLEKTKQKEKQLQRELEPEPVQDPQWRVLLHNDEYHTFDFVSLTVTKVCPLITRARAHTIALETHRKGLGTVHVTTKKRAQAICVGLQKAGLTASVAPDADFENAMKNRRED